MIDDYYYIYNNEALVASVIASILNVEKEIDLSRLVIMVCLLLDNRFLSFIKKAGGGYVVGSVKPYFLANFNVKYVSALPVVINSLVILYDLNRISLKGNRIFVKNIIPVLVEDSVRFLTINKVLPGFLKYMDDFKTEYLYSYFGVEL
ncbi:hypothetical protein [Acinetobacter haemolyticus]|uniref:hypothetical protein n=1 Tax=Acinetobacter haemolyticus TaxID=29430 RepID=UPI0024DEC5E4|nr:hypothetical protein [Acinetobacter haemolyticus]